MWYRKDLVPVGASKAADGGSEVRNTDAARNVILSR